MFHRPVTCVISNVASGAVVTFTQCCICKVALLAWALTLARCLATTFDTSCNTTTGAELKKHWTGTYTSPAYILRFFSKDYRCG